MSPNEHPESQRAPEKPIPGTIKENVPLALRPLAPKAPPRFRPLAIRGSSDSLFASSSGQQTGQRRGRTENRCPVCFKRNCSLTSHKLHNEANSPRRSHALSIARIPLSQDNFAVSYAVNFAAFYDGSSASPANLKLLDQLTIPSDLNRPQMNQLFHTWFVVEAPKHFTVPRPAQIKSDMLHSPFLAPAFTDPVLCLSILTISAASRPQRSSSSNNVLALTLFDQAMTKLRERVNADQDSVTDTTIVAATYLWAANLYLGDDASLRQHASSVRALVEARKDFEESGLSEAVTTLVKWVDIMNSLRLNRPSQYPDDSKLEISQSIIPHSGSAWRSDESQQVPTSDEAVLKACYQCCNMIDLLDRSSLEATNVAIYIYLFQKVAQLYQESAILRARYFATGTLEECLILAVDLLKLIVFNGGGAGSSSLALKLQAKYLSTAIQATGGGMFWRTKMHLFVWIVFLVHVCKPSGEHRRWSLFVLRGALEHLFGTREDWSSDTIDQLRKMLFGFGWSHIAPLADLEGLCDELWT